MRLFEDVHVRRGVVECSGLFVGLEVPTQGCMRKMYTIVYFVSFARLLIFKSINYVCFFLVPGLVFEAPWYCSQCWV